jgi:hypothetical protein
MKPYQGRLTPFLPKPYQSVNWLHYITVAVPKPSSSTLQEAIESHVPERLMQPTPKAKRDSGATIPSPAILLK